MIKTSQAISMHNGTEAMKLLLEIGKLFHIKIDRGVMVQKSGATSKGATCRSWLIFPTSQGRATRWQSALLESMVLSMSVTHQLLFTRKFTICRPKQSWSKMCTQGTLSVTSSTLCCDKWAAKNLVGWLSRRVLQRQKSLWNPVSYQQGLIT